MTIRTVFLTAACLGLAACSPGNAPSGNATSEAAPASSPAAAASLTAPAGNYTLEDTVLTVEKPDGSTHDMSMMQVKHSLIDRSRRSRSESPETEKTSSGRPRVCQSSRLSILTHPMLPLPRSGPSAALAQSPRNSPPIILSSQASASSTLFSHLSKVTPPPSPPLALSHLP